MESKNSIMPGADLDAVDEQIIAALQKDGRVAFAQIAEQLGVSPGMIRMRYNRMVELGVLQVVAITNPLRIGHHTMAIIGIHADGSRLLEVADAIAAFKEVIYLVVTSGRYDLICEVSCRDQADLLRFLSEKLFKIEGVRNAESFIDLKIVKEIYF